MSHLHHSASHEPAALQCNGWPGQRACRHCQSDRCFRAWVRLLLPIQPYPAIGHGQSDSGGSGPSTTAGGGDQHSRPFAWAEACIACLPRDSPGSSQASESTRQKRPDTTTRQKRPDSGFICRRGPRGHCKGPQPGFTRQRVAAARATLLPDPGNAGPAEPTHK